MADDGVKKNVDFYQILGLEKECSPTDLKNAYRKLAKKWHPDRCSASGNSKFVEEAKMKFQAIQEAYSVLSDETKRFLYDVGVYDKDDDDNNHGMGDFLNEMVTMMSDHQPSGNGEESFEQLQEMFEEMFERDSIDTFASTSQGISPSCSSSYANSIDSSFIMNKRNSSEMNRTDASSPFNASFQSFCTGVSNTVLPSLKQLPVLPPSAIVNLSRISGMVAGISFLPSDGVHGRFEKNKGNSRKNSRKHRCQ